MFQSKHKIIENNIISMNDGEVVTVSDFKHIAMPQTVSKVMTRLCDKHLVSKICRGIFWKSSKKDDVPDLNLVAKALARENAWSVVPCGDTALYLFGLTDKKPKVWTYASNGAYKTYKLYGQKIRFKHTTGKVMNSMSERTMMLIQVLKAYGKELVSDELLAKLGQHYKKEEASVIVAETRNTTRWISNAVKRMFRTAAVAGAKA